MSFDDISHILTRGIQRQDAMAVISVIGKESEEEKEVKKSWTIVSNRKFSLVLCWRRHCHHIYIFVCVQFFVWQDTAKILCSNEWDENNWVRLWNDLEDKIRLYFRLQFLQKQQKKKKLTSALKESLSKQ